MGPLSQIAALLGTFAARPGALFENRPLMLIALLGTNVTRQGAGQAGARRPETTLAQIGQPEHAGSEALPARPLERDKVRATSAGVGTAKALARAAQAGREASLNGFIGHGQARSEFRSPDEAASAVDSPSKSYADSDIR
jgi:hypothetical protein